MRSTEVGAPGVPLPRAGVVYDPPLAVSASLAGPGFDVDGEAERQRVAALHLLGLLDAPADDDLQAVVRVAAAVAGVPFSTLNLIDTDRQCQLTSVGFDGFDSEREHSMCALHFLKGRTVHVPDASQDPRYRDNPWVDGRLGGVRLYVSVPLVTAEGHALGSLYVFDTAPGHLSEQQLTRLEDLAVVLLALFERQRQLRLTEELAAQLEERTELAEAVLDTIDVAVVAAGPDGRLTMFNRAAQEWHDLPADPEADPAEHAGRYALFEADGTTPLTGDRVPLHRALADGAVSEQEMVIAAPGHRPRTVLVSGRSMARGDGTPLGAVVAMGDVTDARARTRALEVLHGELADRGAELERSNDELARFAAVASHDLRSPMTVVDGYLELVEDEVGEQLPEVVRGWVAAARRSVRRMQHLTSSLLDYATAGAPSRPAEDVDVATLAADAVADLRTAVEAAGATVELRPLPVVACEAVAVRQLLQNLISNAVQHRVPGRGCRVVVSAAVDATDGGWRFSVADDGPGVRPEDRARVFEVFTTLPEPAGGTAVTQHRRGGHGIGLATCQRIVARHGGRIWLEDTPGGGATVLFRLPGAPTA